MRKRFQHDCERCVFLGEDAEHDFYWCAQGSLPTVIARYGDEGPDYLSGLEVARQVRGKLDFDHPLAQALTLAEQKGYLVRKPGLDFESHGSHTGMVLRLDSALLERKLRPVRGIQMEVLDIFQRRVLSELDAKFRYLKTGATLQIAIEREVEFWIRSGQRDLFTELKE